MGQSAYLAHVAASGGTSATSRRPAAEAPKDRQQTRPGPVWKPEEGGDRKSTGQQKVGKSFNEVREADPTPPRRRSEARPARERFAKCLISAIRTPQIFREWEAMEREWEAASEDARNASRAREIKKQRRKEERDAEHSNAHQVTTPPMGDFLSTCVGFHSHLSLGW